MFLKDVLDLKYSGYFLFLKDVLGLKYSGYFLFLKDVLELKYSGYFVYRCGKALKTLRQKTQQRRNQATVGWFHI